MRRASPGAASRWALWTLLAKLARCGLSEEAAPGELRGVAPADLAKYRPVAGRGGEPAFRCFGAAGSAGPIELPFAAVNDDACDCPDGSDEPGTDACAGQSQTLFFCRNEHSDAAYIYASRVNDGICDCCDGSDEWRAGAGTGRRCQNGCLEEGQKLSKARAAKEAELRGGVERRRALAAAAAEEKRFLEEELARLKAELPSLESRAREAKTELERAERREKEEPPAASPAGGGGESASAEEAADDASVDEADSSAAVDAAAAGDAVKAPVVSEYAKWMEGAGQAEAASGSAAPAEAAPKAQPEAVVSEYTKWMEGAEEALTKPEAAAPTPPPAPPRPPAPRPPPAPAPAPSEGLLGRLQRKARGMFDRLWYRDPPVPVATARQAHTDAKDKLTRRKDRKEEVEKKLGHMKDESTLPYSSLAGRCLSLKVGEYDYSVCFFDRATQDGQSSTSVGSWGKWEEPGVALFEEGEMCPGGPARSLRVRFRCGPEEQLLEVSEPSRCAYEAEAAHPAACTEEALEALLSRGPRRPTDEL